TSMAAPHVTGGVALLLQRFPYLTVTQVRDVMLTTATDLGAPGVEEIYGWGMMNLRKAIDGPGQLRVDSEIRMTQRAGGARVWQGDAWDDWRNDISGKGALIKSGPGILRLSGRNRFGGLRVREGAIELTGDNAYAARVEGGTLQVDGSLETATLPILAGARLQGRGRIIGDVHMAGTIAPGNSIGTLTVQGDYAQAPNSTYLAEVAPDGRGDRIEVSGRATLQGGQVVVTAQPGKYLLGQSFDLLRAAGGLTGGFASLQQSGLSPFLAFGLRYSPRAASLDVMRGHLLAAYAATPNQRATARAADRLAVDQGLPRVLTQLSPGAAMDALDALSGASHASQRSLLLEDGRRLREAAFDRLRSGRGQFAADRKGAASHGAWAQVQMTSLSLPGDGNAAAARHQGNGGLIGYDHRFESGLRLGILGGGSRSDGQFGRFERSRVRSKQIGVYAGQQWGELALASSFSWAGHDIRMDRQIAFDGFSDRTRASYDARSRQWAVEVSYRFAFAAGDVAPYVEWARNWINSEAFQEQGGAAALSGRSGRGRVDFSTVGLRWGMDLRGSGQQEPWLRLQGSVGRRFASGDLLPQATLHWRGGDAFTVSGVPVARQSTVVSLGVAARLSRNGVLDLGYDGQFAGKVRDHGVRARYTLRF
ncbi:MAG TPA: autotransporter domain-containing protein, partial [Stenotrophomonas sp.]|nr:autotransporter domain-containing protein [Stenotrophomonas sp.]